MQSADAAAVVSEIYLFDFRILAFSVRTTETNKPSIDNSTFNEHKFSLFAVTIMIG